MRWGLGLQGSARGHFSGLGGAQAASREGPGLRCSIERFGPGRTAERSRRRCLQSERWAGPLAWRHKRAAQSSRIPQRVPWKEAGAEGSWPLEGGDWRTGAGRPPARTSASAPLGGRWLRSVSGPAASAARPVRRARPTQVGLFQRQGRVRLRAPPARSSIACNACAVPGRVGGRYGCACSACRSLGRRTSPAPCGRAGQARCGGLDAGSRYRSDRHGRSKGRCGHRQRETPGRPRR